MHKDVKGMERRQMGIQRGAILFLLTFCLIGNLAAQNLPLPTGFVNDFVGIMNSRDAAAARDLAAAVKEKTGAELALVTVNSYAPYASINDFSLALAESWGIGERNKDNGILLILAMTEREVRIEVSYGFEGAIPDSAAGRILDNVVIPAFREGDFSGGLLAGFENIASLVVKEMGVELPGYDLPEVNEANGPSSVFVAIFTLFIWVLVVVVFLILALRRRGRGYSSGRSIIGTFGGGGRSFGGGSFRGFSGGSFGGGGAFRRF